MIVLAHRGVFYRGLSENTLDAFEEGIRQGADGIEFDLRVSKDGELIVIHDTNLHRVAGDAHRVTELTASELAELSLRHGGRIPTLHDVTSRIHEPAILDMELNQPDAAGPLLPLLFAGEPVDDGLDLGVADPGVAFDPYCDGEKVVGDDAVGGGLGHRLMLVAVASRFF